MVRTYAASWHLRANDSDFQNCRATLGLIMEIWPFRCNTSAAACPPACTCHAEGMPLEALVIRIEFRANGSQALGPQALIHAALTRCPSATLKASRSARILIPSLDQAATSALWRIFGECGSVLPLGLRGRPQFPLTLECGSLLPRKFVHLLRSQGRSLTRWSIA